eukprot:Sdes_comp19376_c0_seq1m10639
MKPTQKLESIYWATGKKSFTGRETLDKKIKYADVNSSHKLKNKKNSPTKEKRLSLDFEKARNEKTAILSAKIKDLCVTEKQKIAKLILKLSQSEEEKQTTLESLKRQQQKFRDKFETVNAQKSQVVSEMQSLKTLYDKSLEDINFMKEELHRLLSIERKKQKLTPFKGAQESHSPAQNRVNAPLVSPSFTAGLCNQNRDSKGAITEGDSEQTSLGPGKKDAVQSSDEGSLHQEAIDKLVSDSLEREEKMAAALHALLSSDESTSEDGEDGVYDSFFRKPISPPIKKGGHLFPLQSSFGSLPSIPQTHEDVGVSQLSEWSMSAENSYILADIIEEMENFDLNQSSDQFSKPVEKKSDFFPTPSKVSSLSDFEKDSLFEIIRDLNSSSSSFTSKQ